MKPNIKLGRQMALVAAATIYPFLAATSAQAQYTFGPEIQSTSSANIAYNSASGMFQYTDVANPGNDFAALPLSGNAASLITASGDWTASLTANFAQRTMTATGTEEPSVGMGLVIEINGSVNDIVYVALEQVNDTGIPGYNLFGNGAVFAAETNGMNAQTTPLDGSQLQNSGVSLLQLSAETATGPATEINSSVTGVLTLTFSAASDTLTGFYNGTPVGSISLTQWGPNPALGFAVLGISGQGIAVAAGTDTASNFLVRASASVPTIQFTASPTNGSPPLTVQFSSPNVDSLGNAITRWNWNFGDGGGSTLQNPSHTYTTAGTFTPSLTVTNDQGVAVIGNGPRSIQAQVTPMQVFWPLNDGDQKAFIYGNTNPLTMFVSGLGGGQFGLSESSDAVNATLNLVADANSSSMDSVRQGWVTVSFNPSVLLLNNTVLQNGGTLTTSTTVSQSGISYPATFTVQVAKAGTVTVPAGTYYNCRSITATEVAQVPGQGTVSASALTAYLAPDVGIIKTLVSSGVWAELVSGTVGGVDVSAFAGSYTITVSASPNGGGTVAGGGTFPKGSSQTVTAIANNGYTFANWTENGTVVGSSASYTFALNGDRNLVANFTPPGALEVTLGPADAVAAGAQWRRTGTTTWHNSGDTETGLASGQTTVEFKPIAGWNTPAPQTVTIVNGDTTPVSASYTRQTGAVEVAIQPPEVISAGAQWRLAGATTWWNSGQIETNVPTGQYTVEFSDVADWVRPAPIAVSVSNNFTTLVSGSYVMPPLITNPPVSITVTQGSTAQFTVGVRGTPPLAYQWTRNGTPLADNGTTVLGSRSDMLTLANVTTNDSGSRFAVTVSNAGGTNTSAPAILTVVLGPAPPKFLTEPADQRVAVGANAHFSADIYGWPPPGYQWWFGTSTNPAAGHPFAGADATTLTLPSVSTNQAGWYWLVATNSEGSATSRLAKLAVVVPPAIVSQPASLVVTQGDVAVFNVDASGTEPLHYQWQFKNTDLAGATTASLILSNVQPDRAGDYQVRIMNDAGSVTSRVASLTVLVPPAFTRQPQGQTVCEGSDVSFTAAATGNPPPVYQWRKDGLPLPGQNAAMLALTNAQSADAGDYDVVAGNSAGAVTSIVARLTVNLPPTIVQQPSDQAATPGSTVQFNVLVTGDGPFSYQWRKDGTNISGATNAMLVLMNVQTNAAAGYSVRVANECGAAISATANLTVVSRSLRVVSAKVMPGASVPLTVQLVGNGAENRARFSLAFNRMVLNLANVTLGGDDTNATLVWSNLPDGEVLLDVALPTNQVFTPGGLDLVVLNMTVPAAVTNTTVALVNFGSVGQVLDATGAALPYSPLNGTVTIGGAAVPQPDPVSGLYDQTIAIAVPPGGVPTGQALLVLVEDLGVDSQGRPIQVYNQSGVTNGVPYLLLNGPLAGGTTAQLSVQYLVLDRKTVPSPRFVVEAGPGIPTAEVTGTPVPIAGTNAWFAAGVFYLQFPTVSGRTYYVQYKDSLSDPEWQTAWPPVTGTGGWFIWVDNGPPKTSSPPQSSRFYRTLRAP